MNMFGVPKYTVNNFEVAIIAAQLAEGRKRIRVVVMPRDGESGRL
jgi:hypothetical protein